MTFDTYVRFVILPALGTAAFVALCISLRQAWREYRTARIVALANAVGVYRGEW